ncbi:hypothetical protein RCIA26 [Methanocella arvoryzae MRE50]|uniref:Uncharacterized protein n=1 Tax=Methanocella arvoryzae (strain DSM 22066 / NBRC 105507 / MRE50) TaxID=351160 RepID=Q0W6H6_METAR|nr:hypothetical protein RCIA26 [Methanocella arvoryzae MRE50]
MLYAGCMVINFGISCRGYNYVSSCKGGLNKRTRMLRCAFSGCLGVMRQQVERCAVQNLTDSTDDSESDDSARFHRFLWIAQLTLDSQITTIVGLHLTA